MEVTSEQYWTAAFQQAWEAFCNGSFPIGAIVVNEQGTIISKGRNKVYEQAIEPNQITNNKLAHAEMNALLQIDNIETNASRSSYHIFTTMEPCPLCFGAIVMSGLKHIYFAARDRVVGSTNLRDGNEYIAGKNLKISGPIIDLEVVQVVLMTVFILKRGHAVKRLLDGFRKDCPKGVRIGQTFFEKGVLEELKKNGGEVEQLFEIIQKES